MISVDGLAIRMTAGDTGAITFEADDFEVLPGDLAVFTVKTRYGQVMLERNVEPDGNAFTVVFANADTERWKNDAYLYDIRIVRGAKMDETGRIVDGDSVMTPFAPSPFVIERAVGVV